MLFSISGHALFVPWIRLHAFSSLYFLDMIGTEKKTRRIPIDFSKMMLLLEGVWLRD
jgi:hypothetical protein